MATRIGCDNFHYAKMSTEDTKTTKPTYAAPKAAPGLMSLNINPNAGMDTLFADDGPFDAATTLGNLEVEVQKAFLTTENKADLLGKRIDTKGGLISSGNDIPPWVAIAFRSLKSNGNYRYVWLFKGKFMDPEDNNETKGDSINWQSDTISGRFVKLTYEMSISTDKFTPWKYEMDEDDTQADADVIEAWFDAVTFPTV